MADDSRIIYYSDNGYKGCIYGKSNLVIRDKDGGMCFHTCKRNIETYHELKEFVDSFPEFLKRLEERRKINGKKINTPGHSKPAEWSWS